MSNTRSMLARTGASRGCGAKAGADGLIIEVHPRPAEALSDGPQSLKPDRFAQVIKKILEDNPTALYGL